MRMLPAQMTESDASAAFASIYTTWRTANKLPPSALKIIKQFLSLPGKPGSLSVPIIAPAP